MLFDRVAKDFSKKVTTTYSTSFSIGISLLDQGIRDDIYAIYAFVRFADEIVDTFHFYDKRSLLEDFCKQTYMAVSQKISMNPVLHQFQQTVNKYQIDSELIDAFLNSMKMDLDFACHSQSSYEEYIVGSAEVVGLMCLKVFVQGDQSLYCSLTPYARRLGAAFQKVNFLRDIKADAMGLGRQYFPTWKEGEPFDEIIKQQVLYDIREDFKIAREGICKLPIGCKVGVYAAYVYYKALLLKIGNTPSSQLMEARIRVDNFSKLLLLCYAGVRVKLNYVR
ncbi:MAG: phytoene/squalene synthase family protein [Saprospiraceae bacterium]